MSSLISPGSSIFLPLSQLSPHCNRLLTCLHDGRTSQKERVLYEQTLWNEVKKIRSLNDKSIFLYLIGYYHAILYQTATKLTAQHDLFQYHVLIRLGDLNRYMERHEVAEYYYCNARNLFPYFGQAYNQLGLLIKPINCYKCCYYYARAARSSEKPLNTIADSNLRIAVRKYNCELLNHVLNGCDSSSMNSISCDKERIYKPESLPENVSDWFYVIVIAIYADNIQPITKLFLNYLNENFSIQKFTVKRENQKMTSVYCDQKSYILLACLDILLDWLKNGSQCKTIITTVNAELRQIKTSLQAIITQCQTNDSIHLLQQQTSNNNSSEATSTTTIMDTSLTRLSTSNSNSTLHNSSATDSSKISTTNKLPALPHDYVMRGFKPLDNVHRDLYFKTQIRTECCIETAPIDNHSSDERFIETEQLLQITLRIKWKMDAFGPLIRRKTRNIALESILSIQDQGEYV